MAQATSREPTSQNCEECGAAFPSPEALQRHMAISHPERMEETPSGERPNEMGGPPMPAPPTGEDQEDGSMEPNPEKERAEDEGMRPGPGPSLDQDRPTDPQDRDRNPERPGREADSPETSPDPGGEAIEPGNNSEEGSKTSARRRGRGSQASSTP